MSAFEYVIPLVSVLIGLALADLAVSFNRLLRARHRVDWDHLPLLTALMAILAVLEIWWTFYGEQDATFYHTLGGFLPLTAQLIILFLINAAALPDDVPGEGLDLRAFYARNETYFWTLFIAYYSSLFVTHAVSAALAGQSVPEILANGYRQLIFIACMCTLLVFKNRWYHTLIALAYLAFYLVQASSRSLAELP